MGQNDVAQKTEETGRNLHALLFFKGVVATILVSVAKYPKRSELKFKRKCTFMVGKLWGQGCELAVYTASTIMEQTEK